MMQVIIAFPLLFLLATCSTTKQFQKEITTGSGLRYSIWKKGTGEPAQKGQQVAIYESMGYLNGKNFYSLERPAPPIKFTLGEKQVIAGVEEAVTGMQVGEIRRLIVPPALSKRQFYPPGLSPDSALLYKIELVEIIK